MNTIFKIENNYIVPFKLENNNTITCRIVSKKMYDRRYKSLIRLADAAFEAIDSRRVVWANTDDVERMKDAEEIYKLSNITVASSGNDYFKALLTDTRFVIIRYTKDKDGNINNASVVKAMKYSPNVRDSLYAIYGPAFKFSYKAIKNSKTTIIMPFGCKDIFMINMQASYIINILHKNVYHSFKKVCKNGKVRTLYEPFVGENDEIYFNLKELYRELNGTLYSKYGDTNPGIQIAYKKGKCIVDNAVPHKDHRYIFKADISDFFPSCKEELVRAKINYLFKDNQPCRERVIKFFLNNLLVDGGLCLGNPVSSTLANAIVAGAARYMYNMCAKSGMTFTQYSDDITISSDRPIAKEFVKSIFNEAYTHCGLNEYFVIKDKKLIGQVGQYRNVCGIAFDHTNNNKPTVRRGLWREIRVKIDKLSHGQAQNMSKLIGQINYMKSVCGEERIKHYLDKFPGLNDRYHLITFTNRVEGGEGNEENE